jgi:hypothetical protein
MEYVRSPSNKMEQHHSSKDVIACCCVVLLFQRDVTQRFRSIPATFIANTLPHLQYGQNTLVQQRNSCVFSSLVFGDRNQSYRYRIDPNSKAGLMMLLRMR